MMRSLFCCCARPTSDVLPEIQQEKELPVEDAVLKIKELETRAAELHVQAQLQNKQGLYDDARKTYNEMHAVEDQALRVSYQVCNLPSVKDSEDSEPEVEETNTELPNYQRLLLPTPWQCLPDVILSSDELQQRALACVVGSLTADAAAMGVQWIYDLKVIDKLSKERQQQAQASGLGTSGLEFMEPPQSPFFSYPSGRNSPYGEQTLVLLRSMAAQGGLHCSQYADAFAQHFGPGFEGYRDVSTKGFLRNHSMDKQPPHTGADDFQANCVARLAPLVAAYAGHPHLLELVQCATRVTQDTDAAVAWACTGALVLEGILLGRSALQSVKDTVRELTIPTGRLYFVDVTYKIVESLNQAIQYRSWGHPDAATAFGRNCHMPAALQTPLHVVLHMEHLAQQAGSAQGEDGQPSRLPAESYVEGIRAALSAGGCCSSRASYAGACLAALCGLGAVPTSWQQRYSSYADVHAAATKICVDLRA